MSPALPGECEEVYSLQMANPPDLSQRLATLEKQLDKADDKREKMGEKLNALIAERVVPTEAKVNQIHGIAKWFVPTILGLLVMIVASGGGIFYKLGRLEQRLDGDSSTIGAIQRKAAELSAKVIVSSPDAVTAVRNTIASPVKTRSDIIGIAAIIDEAANRKLEVPPDVIKTAANNLIGAAEPSGGNDAWDAVLKLARYRSALNERYAPSIAFAVAVKSTEFPAWGIEDGHWNGFVRLLGKVPYAESARLGNIDRPQKTNPPEFGPEWAFVYPHEHNIVLDGKDAKNTVFMGVTIEYSGGPARLENVYFVNCTFRGRRSPAGEKFMLAVLDSPRTNFRSA